MRVLFLISTKKMCKIINLKVRENTESEARLVGENEVKVWLEECYNKKFATYFNKKGRCFRGIVHIPDEDWNKELDIHYQDVFATQSEAVEECQKFLDQWFNNFRITYL